MKLFWVRISFFRRHIKAIHWLYFFWFVLLSETFRACSFQMIRNIFQAFFAVWAYISIWILQILAILAKPIANRFFFQLDALHMERAVAIITTEDLPSFYWVKNGREEKKFSMLKFNERLRSSDISMR